MGSVCSKNQGSGKRKTRKESLSNSFQNERVADHVYEHGKGGMQQNQRHFESKNSTQEEGGDGGEKDTNKKLKL